MFVLFVTTTYLFSPTALNPIMLNQGQNEEQKQLMEGQHQELKQLMEKMDKKLSGQARISKPAVPAPKPTQEEIRNDDELNEVNERSKVMFHNMDTDKNGFLDFEEVLAALLAKPYKMREKEIQELFDEMDKNKDDLITLEEFCDGQVLIILRLVFNYTFK